MHKIASIVSLNSVLTITCSQSTSLKFNYVIALSQLLGNFQLNFQIGRIDSPCSVKPAPNESTKLMTK